MFCKWCGGNIAPLDAKCKRCGKEVPALSDCGGFYDIVPDAKKIEVIPVTPSPPPKDPPESKRKGFLGLAVLTAIGFLIVILLLIFVLGKVTQYSDDVNGLRSDIKIMSGKIDSLAKVAEPEVTESTVPPAPVLAEQHVRFTAIIALNGNVQADLDLGDYNDTAVVSYGLEENTGSVNTISYALHGADTAVFITIDRSNDPLSKNVSVSYALNGTAYGLAAAPETYKWQYRLSSEADWIDLSTDTIAQVNGTEKTELSISETALRELIAGGEKEIELRCEISRVNTENGSLTIVLEGITLRDEEANEKHTLG